MSDQKNKKEEKGEKEIEFTVKNHTVLIPEKSPLYVVWEENKKEKRKKNKKEKDIFQVAYEHKLITKLERDTIYDILKCEKFFKRGAKFFSHYKNGSEEKILHQVHLKCNIPYLMCIYVSWSNLCKWIAQYSDIHLFNYYMRYLTTVDEKMEKIIEVVQNSTKLSPFIFNLIKTHKNTIIDMGEVDINLILYYVFEIRHTPNLKKFVQDVIELFPQVNAQYRRSGYEESLLDIALWVDSNTARVLFEHAIATNEKIKEETGE